MKKRKMEAITVIEKSVLREISKYFGSSVHDLGIKSIKVKRNKIFILLSRPELFIGKHGQDIWNIQNQIKKNQKWVKLPEIYLYESELDSYLSFHEYINPDYEFL